MAKNILTKIIRFCISFLIFLLLLRVVIINWSDVKQFEFHFNYYFLVLSILPPLFGIFLIGVIWRNILKYLGYDDVSLGKSIEINVLTNFSKYVPGKLWGVLGVMYLVKESKIPKKILAYSYLIQTVIGVVSAIFWGSILSLIYFGAKYYYLYYFLFFSFFLFFLLLKQKYFIFVLNFVLKYFGKKEIDANIFLSARNVFYAFFQLSIIRFLNGLGFFLLLLSFYDLSLRYMFLIIGLYILANVFGYLLLFLPAGLGAKEGALMFLLKFYLPVGISAFLALLSRFWLVGTDILAFILFYFYKKIVAKYRYS